MQGFIRNPKTGWRSMGQETVILDFQKKRLIGLNKSAGWIWDQLTTPKTISWLASHFSEDRQGNSVACVSRFMDEMTEHGLFIQTTIEADEANAKPSSVFSDAPHILWQEPLEQVAGTCALVSGQSILCNQAPFS